MGKMSRRSCNLCSPYVFKIQELTCKAPEEIYLQKSRLQQNIQINKNDKNINSINCNWINICIFTLRLKVDHMEDRGAGNRREKIIYRSGWGNQLKWEIEMRGNSSLHIFTLLFFDAVFSLAPTFKCKTKVSERYMHSYFLKLDLGRKFFKTKTSITITSS